MIFQLTDPREWHTHFAILPQQTIDNKLVWMQKCERREVYTGYSADLCDEGGYHWEYRL